MLRIGKMEIIDSFGNSLLFKLLLNIIQTMIKSSTISHNYFQSHFYNNCIATNQQIQSWNFINIRLFPLVSLINEGDMFFKKMWEIIDSSRKYVWITTYAINSSPPADATIYKLIDAARRGVHVILLMDNVQNWARQSLVQELKNMGGVCQTLNPQFQLKSIYNYYTKDVWRRHHQKLVVSDNKALIGSSNIEDAYGGIKYGNRTFVDLNLYCQNIALKDFRKHFLDVANLYQIKLSKQLTNQSLQHKFNQQYPNSQFYDPQKYFLIHNNRLGCRQIQNYIIKNINLAQKDIKIIVPYFFNMANFNYALAEANKRGVKTEIITSRNRQQLVFKDFSNNMFFRSILKAGTSIYQTKQRFLHTKLYIFDGKRMTLGSINNDRWSWIINNQMNFVIQQERFCHEADQYYQNMKARCLKVQDNYKFDVQKLPTISFWINFLYLSQIVMGKYQNIQEDCIEQQIQID